MQRIQRALFARQITWKFGILGRDRNLISAARNLTRIWFAVGDAQEWSTSFSVLSWKPSGWTLKKFDLEVLRDRLVKLGSTLDLAAELRRSALEALV